MRGALWVAPLVLLVLATAWGAKDPKECEGLPRPPAPARDPPVLF
jgi:hypothetical protein